MEKIDAFYKKYIAFCQNDGNFQFSVISLLSLKRGVTACPDLIMYDLFYLFAVPGLLFSHRIAEAAELFTERVVFPVAVGYKPGSVKP